MNRYIEASTVDDLLHLTFEFLFKHPVDINTSRGKINFEVIGSLLHLKNPRARISLSETRGRPFSAIGELAWYLAVSNDVDFITHYIPHYKKEAQNGIVNGAYGPRLFNMRGKINQIENVIELLKKRRSSRKAIIQLYDAIDLHEDHKEFPCTCSLQFFIRDNKLNMHTSMRSNDAYIGLPHDIFTFTMLQEIIAIQTNSEIGEYTHTVGSLHLYEKDTESINLYLNEGWQSTKKAAMPPMPKENIFDSLSHFVKYEEVIRKGKELNIDTLKLPDYWKDLLKLLQVHWHFKQKDNQKIQSVAETLSAENYSIYIDQKLEFLKKQAILKEKK